MKRKTAKRVAGIGIVTALAVILASGIVKALIPFELDYVEGVILDAGMRVLHGGNPYPAPGLFPYVFNIYGPVGYVLTAAGIKVLGVSLLGPRLLVWIAGCAIAILIAAITKRMGGTSHAGILMGTLYLASPLVALWYPLLRVDFWAVSLSLAGLYLFLVYPAAPYISGLAFALALLTKQTAVAAPAACLLILVLERGFKRIAALAAPIAVALLTCYLILGNNFLYNTIRAHPHRYQISWLVDVLGSAIQGFFLPIAIAAYWIFIDSRCAREFRLLWFYLIGCSITAVTAGNQGANTNHFLEWGAAVSITAGIALSRLLKTADPLGKVFYAGMVLIVVLFSFRTYRSALTFTRLHGCAEAYSFIRTFPGLKILSEDVASLVLGGKPVLVSDPFVSTQVGDSIGWSMGNLQHLVDRQYFDLIVLGDNPAEFHPESGRWSVSVMEAVSRRYRIARKFQCTAHCGVAYVPKAR